MTKQAATIYIIHGWTYSIEPWTATVSLLRTAGYEVKQLRVPGLTAESDAVWTIEDYVAWLHDELAGAKQPIIIGHSNGGRIALNYLRTHPGSFSKLILLNSAGVYVNPGATSLKRKVFKALATVLKPLKYIPIVRKVVYRVIGGSDYERAPANMKQTLHNMLQSDQHLVLTDIQTPTVVLWGEADQITPLGQGQKMARELPHARLETATEWAHAPYITHPNQLATALIQAIEEVQ